MDAGVRHKIPGSKAKASVLLMAVTVAWKVISSELGFPLSIEQHK